MIIAVDGPAASGKGTLSRRLAARLGYAHLDTGKLYRAVGMAVVRAGKDPADVEAATAAAHALDWTGLGDPALTTDQAGTAASKVAAIPPVRAALLDFQRRFAGHPPDGARGAVLDGRDIGTVVCPDADLKLFVTAGVEVRAKRRYEELRAAGLDVNETDVLRDMQERDARDSARAVAPLVAADDAVVIDTSGMTADQVLDTVLGVLADKAGR